MRPSAPRAAPAQKSRPEKSIDNSLNRELNRERTLERAQEPRRIEGSPAREPADRRAVNVDNRRQNVNTEVDRRRQVEINERNTVVRANPRPYARPPYVYGDRRYYAHHSYSYHVYQPYYWGPTWHPWGFFAVTLAATAVAISLNDQEYYYDDGVYYVPGNGGYTAVAAPIGATVSALPQGARRVVVSGDGSELYYYGSTFYQRTGSGYTVVAPVAGTVVEHLPEGGQEVRLGDQTYVRIGSIYFQPIQLDGKNMYEVVQVEGPAQ